TPPPPSLVFTLSLHDALPILPALVLLGRAADDQRRPRLVDEDRVDLVDDRVLVAALDEIAVRPGHVVAEVVEAEFVVGAVGDVGDRKSTRLNSSHLGISYALF